MSTLYVIILVIVYLTWRLLRNRFDKRFYEVEKISEEDIEKGKGIVYGVSKLKILAETVFYMSVIMLLFLAAFDHGFSEGRELAYVIVGILLFVITYLRMLVLVYSTIKYDDNYVYVTRGLKKVKIVFDKVKIVDRPNAHISVIEEDNLWIRYIPIHFKNSHHVYKLLLNSERGNKT